MKKLNIRLKPNIDNAVGKPIFKTPDKRQIGSVIEYNSETGDAVIEVEDQVWEDITSQNPDLISRS